jgi:hypothetical protein
VTKNLELALRCVRDGTSERVLWVDAVCIDQNNTAERSAQVAIMGEIYSAATQVVIRLGKSDLHLRPFIKVMDKLSAPLDRYITEEGWETSKEYNIEDSSFYDSLGLVQPTWTEWESYVTFCQRRWFTRAWIVQEAALAKDLVVLCAGVELNWENMQFLSVFLKVSQWGPYLSTRFCGSRLSVPGVEQSVIEYFRHYVREGGPESPQMRRRLILVSEASCKIDRSHAFLEYVLSRIRMFEVSDPKDKVYAGLGIASRFLLPASRPLFRPDYSLSVQQVYTAAASYSVLNVPLLSMLSCVEDRSLRRLAGLPSWVLDFSTRKTGEFVAFGSGGLYDASDVKRTPHSPRTIDNNNVLRITGARIETIGELGTDQPNPHSDFVTDCFRLCSKLPSVYTNGHGRVEVLWRTLIADHISKTTPAPKGVQRDFLDWLLQPTVKTDQSFLQPKSVDALVSGLVLEDAEPLASCLDALRLIETEAKGAPPSPRADYGKFTVLGRTVAQRRLYLTSKWCLLGARPLSTQAGDQVWILKNAKVPFVLRPLSSSGEDLFELVGETYLHDFMHGEMLGHGGSGIQGSWAAVITAVS